MIVQNCGKRDRNPHDEVNRGIKRQGYTICYLRHAIVSMPKYDNKDRGEGSPGHIPIVLGALPLLYCIISEFVCRFVVSAESGPPLHRYY